MRAFSCSNAARPGIFRAHTAPSPSPRPSGERIPRKKISRIEPLNLSIAGSADKNVCATGFMGSFHGFVTAHWCHEPTIGRSADSHVRELQSCGSRGQGCPRPEGGLMGRGSGFAPAGLLTLPLTSLEGGEGGKSRPPQNVSVPGENVSGDLNWRRPLWESFY